MKNKSIYYEWALFINEYKKYFLSNEDQWIKKLNKLKKYIDDNKKLPSTLDTHKNIQSLGFWYSTQVLNYPTKKYIMSNEMIYGEWVYFTKEYKQYLLSRQEKWINIFNKLKKYIDDNKKLPSSIDENKEIKYIGSWYFTQISSYRKKDMAMSNEIIYNTWTVFTEDIKYIKYFKRETWVDKLNRLKDYIDENNKKPSSTSDDLNIKNLAIWCENQVSSYKKKEMSSAVIYNNWTFFTEDLKYIKYFKRETWFDKFDKLKKYIDENNKKPSSTSHDLYIKKLGNFIEKNNSEYKIKNSFMLKNEKIYNAWSEFIENSIYKIYFISTKEEWYDNLNKLKIYINEHSKRPSCESKNINYKKLGQWITTQTNNYKKNKRIMTNKDIYEEWTKFINNEKYYILFASEEEKWILNLNIVKKYINENNKKPSPCSNNKETRASGMWIKRQILKFKNKYENNLWFDFIKDEKYSKYFL